MKLAILANCQSQPLARMLGALPDVTEICALPIHLKGSDAFIGLQARFLEFTQDPSAVVLTFDIGEQFGELSTQALRNASRARVLTMTNVYFSGLHPDITYLGGMQGRIKSPLGDYHSKVIIASFIRGMSIKDCMTNFDAGEFERLGFYQEFDISAAELTTKGKGLDIDFSGLFLGMIKKSPCLYTVNHPTAFVFSQYVHRISVALGIESVQFPMEFQSNYLANSVWWPIYDDIAQAFDLNYRTPQWYKQSDADGGKFLCLEEFVTRSYSFYKGRREEIKNSVQGRRIAEVIRYG